MDVDIYDSSDRMRGETGSPERQLWCAVIGRALHDATDNIATVSGLAERFNIREDARAWFLDNGNDFRIACESAGYDPDYLRSRILSLIDKQRSPPPQARALAPATQSSDRSTPPCACRARRDHHHDRIAHRVVEQ